MSLDPVTLTLVQNRLDHIAQQMGWVMLRTARSPLFSQGHDFSCFITDSEGWILSQADGLPIHTGGGGLAARALIAAFPGRINPGDVFLLNDPYVAGGNHLPDWVILRPVFAHDRLVAFCCNRGHQSDIGGGAPGGYNSAATEIFQEGLRLPPVKLVDRGVLRDDLWNLLLLNSRAPNLMDGDLRAMMGSTRIGMEEVAKLAAELGANAYAGYFAGILDLGERHMRAEIAALPDGIWRGEDGTDTDCFEDRPYRMRVALHVSGETMTVDFTGTDPQMKGFKNSSIANTWSAVYMALIAYLNPNLPANEGTYRPVTIVAPEGTLVNPRPPAPMTMNTIAPATEIIHAIWTALNAADPARSAAGWGKNSAPTMSGRQPDGAPFVMYHWSGAAGTGAIEGRDGFNGTGGLVGLGALYLPDVELYEQGYPVHFLRQAFRCDGGGAGYRRGGTGLDYAADVAVPSVLSLRGEGLRTPSGFGVGGGGTGRAAVMSIRFDDGRALDPPKYGVIPATPMRIALAGAGGGGWGDPLDREPERVVRDVRDGTVSADAAFRDYGVVLAADGRAADLAATAARRRALRSASPRV